MTALLAVFAGIFGLLIGSFLNVVIYRIPAGKSIVSPPSACGSCGARIRSYDNIPVLSWLLLRGKCRHCGAAFSVRYPLVELGTGVFFAVVALWVFSSGDGGALVSTDALLAQIIVLVAFLYLAAVSVALAMIDLDTHTLPNKILLPVYPVGAVLLTAAALVSGEPGRLLSALIGAAALFGLYLALALISPGGMGLGDVKLAGVLGLYLGWLGWAPLIVGAFGAFLLGGLFGIGLLVSRKAGRRSSIPFGPWMLLAAWLGAVFGQSIAAGYLTLYGLT
ncbi:prepilin peptidase [Cryobacterium levicorallinum]|uniref:Prepilin leader peptidase/N-methyltransferase n=1 Tax=Cryobacterium levicorallinum TaxID=995038 RepID=A0A1I3EE19_9MICO|nr:A24 family peptidase [Cryobacterium levicorallinum]TFB83365.1 prepilin peptidase [Cryobacterium levicorallinum]GEP28708.1 prepilin peptidase [Cryobacterium levicorallinum]SFH97217.1 leader peptidase (prepilin peptidase) / N-methyltransferase [Cryobacterium levicorallinum]